MRLTIATGCAAADSALRPLSLTLFLILCGCAVPAAQPVRDTAPIPPRQTASEPTVFYDLYFSAVFTKEKGTARATLRLSQPERILRSIDFKAPKRAYTLVAHDGKAAHKDGRLVWTPPAEGGELVYDYRIDSRRGGTYDARHTPNWVLLRLGDLFPSASVRTQRGASSRSTLDLTGPDGWSFETRYGPLRNGPLSIDDSERNFKRPTGWLVGGKIGTRRDVINGRYVAVSAPVGSGIRRLDTLSFLSWTLPVLARSFPSVPQHILIAGAPADMWRGGLSAPESLYMHAGRPLISENGTSTLLHELIHLSGMHSAAPGADWIVEGVAEYYSLLTLKRSRGISQARFDNALKRLQRWVERDNGTLQDPSKGVDTAAAVLVLHDLAAELHSAGAHIDELTQRVLAQPPISVDVLVTEAAALLGRPSRVLTAALESS